jgi:hypothetical protein
MTLLRQRAVAIFCAGVTLATLGACAKKSDADATNAGTVTSAPADGAATAPAESAASPTDTGGTATIKGKSGELKIGKGAVDAASLGIPVYPGAKPSDAGSMAMANTVKGESSQLTMLETADSFDKVYAFYKGQLPSGSEKMKVETGGSAMAEFQMGDTGSADVKSVTISSSNGKTAIELIHATKSQ